MVYCVEQFAKDGSPVPAIVKVVKRAMAGNAAVSYQRKFLQANAG